MGLIKPAGKSVTTAARSPEADIGRHCRVPRQSAAPLDQAITSGLRLIVPRLDHRDAGQRGLALRGKWPGGRWP